MIVPMVRLTLFCLDRDVDRALEDLRALGAVHVTPLRPAESDGLASARAGRRRLRRVLDVLAAAGERDGSRPEGPSSVAASPGADVPRPSGMSVERVVEDVARLAPRGAELRARLAELETERRRIAPLGRFDPARIEALAARGIQVAVVRAGKELPAIPDAGRSAGERRPSGGQGAVGPVEPGPTGVRAGVEGPSARRPDMRARAVQRLAPESEHLYAVVGRVPLRAEELPRGAVLVLLPERSLDAVDREIAAAETELEELERRFASHAGDRAAVERLLAEAADAVRLEEVRAGMNLSGRVALLRGFAPRERQAEIEALARESGWGYRIEEPAVDDHPPTLIRNPRWVRPIKAVFDMIGVIPGYREADISAPFLFFLSIFFAMLVGDAGYGLLFLALTGALKLLRPKASGRVVALLAVMSTATLIWGALTGTWFGTTVQAGTFAGPLAGLKIGWLTGPSADRNLMTLCFFLGALHLTLAHLWNAVRMFPRPAILAQAGWILLTWTMFFTARLMVLGAPLPWFAPWLLGAGLVLVLLFMVPPSRLREDWSSFMMLPLSVVSNFVDVVSYVRLFAVGAASYAVASAFNDMALSGGAGPLAGLGAALILFFGHGLNILLASMGVLVHGVRLNTLEFAQHMGLQWSGVRYDPFRRGE